MPIYTINFNVFFRVNLTRTCDAFMNLSLCIMVNFFCFRDDHKQSGLILPCREP